MCIVAHGLDDQATDFKEAENGKGASKICVVTTNKINGNPCHTKRAYCLFCEAPLTQIFRHYITKHPTEKEVIKITSSKNRIEKIKYITLLRNLGNHAHNCRVLREGCGDLIVNRRPSFALDPLCYLPCEYCFAYFHKNALFHHKCKVVESKPKGRVAANAVRLLPAPKGMTSSVFQLLTSMNNDKVKLVAKSDSLIIQFASSLLKKYGTSKIINTRSKVREISKFLLEIRKQEELTNISLTDCINTALFKNIVTAVQSLTGFDETTSTYRKGAMVLKVSSHLQSVARIIKAAAIKNSEGEKIDDVDIFLELCSNKWHNKTSSDICKTLLEHKKIIPVPHPEDVFRFSEYLKTEVVQCVLLLTEHASDTINVEEIWRQFVEVTLAQLVCFNRQKFSEIAQLQLDDYHRKTLTNPSKAAQKVMKLMEKKLCALFEHVEITGSRNQTVPILIPHHVRRSIDTLIQFREAANIRSDNTYIFARKMSQNFLRPSDCMRNISLKCTAKEPSTLTSTNFLKHSSKLYQILNMENDRVAQLADLMGYGSMNTEELYRLPNDFQHAEHLSKIFIMMEDAGSSSGSIHKTSLNIKMCRFNKRKNLQAHTFQCKKDNKVGK